MRSGFFVCNYHHISKRKEATCPFYRSQEDRSGDAKPPHERGKSRHDRDERPHQKHVKPGSGAEKYALRSGLKASDLEAPAAPEAESRTKNTLEKGQENKIILG